MLSRRAFLASGAVAALPLTTLPLTALPVRAASAAQPLSVGELWGMPYMAHGTLGNPVLAATRHAPPTMRSILKGFADYADIFRPLLEDGHPNAARQSAMNYIHTMSE